MNRIALRHGFAALVLCAVLGALALNRLAPWTLHADTMLNPLMSLQHTTLFFWGQNRLASIVPFLLSPITGPLANMWAHLWIYAFSFFALFAVLAFAGLRRLAPHTPWADRWLAFLALAAVALLVLDPQAAAVLLVEGHPYAPSFLLLSIAILILTRDGNGILATIGALVCLFASIGLNPAALLVVLALGVLVPAGLKLRRFVFLAVATLVCFAAWIGLSKLGPTPPYSYFNIDLDTIGSDLAAAADGIALAFRPVGLAIVACALGVGAFAGLGHPRGAALRHACLFLLALAIGWWVAFSVNHWVKIANQSHFRFFAVTLVALIIVAALLLFSFARDAGPRLKALYGAVAALVILACLWRPFVPWDKYEAVEAAAPYVDFAARADAQYVVGDYWRAWPVVFELLRRGRPGFGLSWRGEGNRAAIVAAIRAAHREGKVPLALCIGEPATDCIENAEKVSGFAWRESTRTCPLDACLLIEAAPPLR